MAQSKTQLHQTLKNQTNQLHQAQSPHKVDDRLTKKNKPKQKVMTQKMVKEMWSFAEERRYLKFLKTKENLFSLPNLQRRKAKVNVLMSKAIRSKTSNQCHSHHQKMTLKFGSVSAIISSLQQILENTTKSEFQSIYRSTIKMKQEKSSCEIAKLEGEQNELGRVLKEQFDSAYFYIHYYPEQDRTSKQQQEL